jgi:hypothetical protein
MLRSATPGISRAQTIRTLLANSLHFAVQRAILVQTQIRAIPIVEFFFADIAAIAAAINTLR